MDAADIFLTRSDQDWRLILAYHHQLKTSQHLPLYFLNQNIFIGIFHYKTGPCTCREYDGWSVGYRGRVGELGCWSWFDITRCGQQIKYILLWRRPEHCPGNIRWDPSTLHLTTNRQIFRKWQRLPDVNFYEWSHKQTCCSTSGLGVSAPGL